MKQKIQQEAKNIFLKICFFTKSRIKVYGYYHSVDYSGTYSSGKSSREAKASVENRWAIFLALFYSPLLSPSHFHEIPYFSLLKLQFLPALPLTCPLFTAPPPDIYSLCFFLKL